MNCNDKKKFRTSEASSKASLRTKGAIDKFLNILDTNLFRKYNKQWSQDARERFNISGSLFYEENNKAIPNKEAFQKIDSAKKQHSGTQYQLPQNRELEEFVASEKTIRDLAARMSDRIGIPVRYISDRSQQFKGKLENGTAYINLAYATLDTPIHEILGHPIIRSIKNRNNVSESTFDILSTEEVSGYENKKGFVVVNYSGSIPFETLYNTEKEAKEAIPSIIKRLKSDNLYQNLLKELEYGKGKEVLDRIKRDYLYKDTKEGIVYFSKEEGKWKVVQKNKGVKLFDTEQSAREFAANKYTLEEQQEEALVELLGLYTAGKLDNVKDGKLISLLKRLLKEMKQFVRSLINQKEVEINKLPDNMTLGDLADLLAYSNSKLILPGYEVEYTTPDNMKFKTYQEASNHISELAKSSEDINLDNVKVKLKRDSYQNFENQEVFQIEYNGDLIFINKLPNGNYEWEQVGNIKEISKEEAFEYFKESEKQFSINDTNSYIEDFIEKNKEYEQSKEIIEEWKKVNNIQYNPEEVYSRGQEFVSVVGAYSAFDVNLMMQNLLQHIEDNQKAGGEFTISAFTKPVDKKIGHLEGWGGKIKFKIYENRINT